MKCVGAQCECMCVCLSCECRRGEESERGLHSSDSPSSCTPGTHVATCLRGFQYPPCVCARVCAVVFAQGMQFIIFVCVSGYYIYSLHTCTQRQMAQHSFFKRQKKQKNNDKFGGRWHSVTMSALKQGTWSSFAPKEQFTGHCCVFHPCPGQTCTHYWHWKLAKCMQKYISMAVAWAALEAPVGMRPYWTESGPLARADNSCQRLEETACQLKNEGHRAAGVYERPR